MESLLWQQPWFLGLLLVGAVSFAFVFAAMRSRGAMRWLALPIGALALAVTVLAVMLWRDAAREGERRIVVRGDFGARGTVVVQERSEFPFAASRLLFWNPGNDVWLGFFLGHEVPYLRAPALVHDRDRVHVVDGDARLATLDLQRRTVALHDPERAHDHSCIELSCGRDPLQPARRLYRETPGWSAAMADAFRGR